MECQSCFKSLRSQESVLLPCSCCICICQSCARQQLVSEPLKYRSSIKCPNCRTRVLPEHGIINGVEEAEAEEDKIVRRGFAWTSTEHSAPGRITNFTKLQACYNKLKLDEDPNSEPDSTKEPLGARNSGCCQREIEAARFRFEITRLMLEKLPSSPDPLQRITFTNNPYIEMHLEKLSQPQSATEDGHSQDGGHVRQRECVVCHSEIQPGGSVLRMCSCRNILCRICAIKIMIHQPVETFHTGVACPSCRKLTTGVVRNVAFLAQCEDALIRSAEAYLTPRLLKMRRGRAKASEEAENAKKREYYREIIRLYWLLGFQSATMNDLNIEVVTSLHKLRFEVARLEEYRLNSCDIVRTYDLLGSQARDEVADEVPVGFLCAAELQPSVFFERLVLGQTGAASTDDSAVALRNQALLTAISRWYQEGQPVVHFNAVDKIILTAMYIQRDAANPSLPRAFTTQNEVVAAVRDLLQSSLYLKHELPYINHVVKKLSGKVLGEEILPSLYESDLLLDVSPEGDEGDATTAQGQGAGQDGDGSAVAARWRTVNILTEEGPIGASGQPTVLIDPGLQNLATPGCYKLQPPALTLPSNSGASGSGSGSDSGALSRLYSTPKGGRSGGLSAGGRSGGKKVAGQRSGVGKVTARRAAKTTAAAPSRRGGRGKQTAVGSAPLPDSGDSSSGSSDEDSDSRSSGSEAIEERRNSAGVKRPRNKRGGANPNPRPNPRPGSAGAADGMDGSVTADSASSDSDAGHRPHKRANTASTQAATGMDTDSDGDSSDQDASGPLDSRTRSEPPVTTVSVLSVQVTEVFDSSDSDSSSGSDDDEELAGILSTSPARQPAVSVPAGVTVAVRAGLGRHREHAGAALGPTTGAVAGATATSTGTRGATAAVMDLTDIVDSDEEDLPPSPRAAPATAPSRRTVTNARREPRQPAVSTTPTVADGHANRTRPESNGAQAATQQDMLRVIQQQLPVLRKAIVDREDATRRLQDENAQLAARLREEQQKGQAERDSHATAIASLQAQLKAEQQVRAAAEAALEETKRVVNQANEHNSKLTQVVADKEKAVWDLKRDLKAAEDKLATTRDSRDSAETSLKKLQVTINQLKQSSTKTQEDYKIQRGKLDKAVLDVTNKDRQLDAVNSKVTALKTENERLKKELDVKSALSSQAQHMLDENNRLQKELVALQGDVRILNRVVEDRNKQCSALIEENQELKIANQEHLQDIAYLKRKLKEYEDDRKAADDFFKDFKEAGDNNGTGGGEGGQSSGSGSGAV